MGPRPIGPSSRGPSAPRLVLLGSREALRLSVLVTEAPARAREGSGGLDLSRRDLFLWVCAILFFNQMLAAVGELQSASPWRLLSDLADSSVFQILACYA